MFKLPSKPSARAEVHEIADYAELLAWTNRSISAREVLGILGREAENDVNEGCEDDESNQADAFAEVFAEIESRGKACAGRYPFKLDRTGNVLTHITKNFDDVSLYGYLLLCTRLDMKASRVHAGIDGAELFEEVATSGLHQYFGKERARKMVFGTSAGPGKFADKVGELCKLLNEGSIFKNNYGNPLTQKDDRVDSVVWIPFADVRCNKLIIFGQCKTGTAWTEGLCKLQPENFIKKWLHPQLTLNPVRAYCVTEACNQARWNSVALEGGLFFDRCRIMDSCKTLDRKTLTRIRKWNRAAYKAARSLV